LVLVLSLGFSSKENKIKSLTQIGYLDLQHDNDAEESMKMMKW
jgi:hypothetical protein